MSYTYNAAGQYTAKFSAFNLVSSLKETKQVVVQDKVTNPAIDHDLAFVPLVIAKDNQYQFNCSYDTGTDVNCSWDFKDDSSIVTGATVS